jgi:hypothetical protein
MPGAFQNLNHRMTSESAPVASTDGVWVFSSRLTGCQIHSHWSSFRLLGDHTMHSWRSEQKWGSRTDKAFRKTDSSYQATRLSAWLFNAPQLILSFCYLAINGEFTSMAGIAE